MITFSLVECCKFMPSISSHF